jgi:hypothetical protein
MKAKAYGEWVETLIGIEGNNGQVYTVATE